MAIHRGIGGRGRTGLLVAGLAAVALVVAACSGGGIGDIDANGATGGNAGGAQAGGGLSAAQLESLGRSTIPGVSPGGSAGIHVSGVGVVGAQPDVAVLSLGVEGFASTVSEARTIAARAVDGILGVFAGAGVSEDDIETRFFNIQPEYTFERNGRERTLTGYRVTNTLSVKVRELDRIGEIIDGSVAVGGNATRINSISFTLDDSSALEEQARLLALRDAVAKADLFAGETGVQRGKLVFITESSVPQFARTESRAFGAEGDFAAAAPTKVLAGTLDVRVSVQAIFAID